MLVRQYELPKTFMAKNLLLSGCDLRSGIPEFGIPASRKQILYLSNLSPKGKKTYDAAKNTFLRKVENYLKLPLQKTFLKMCRC